MILSEQTTKLPPAERGQQGGQQAGPTAPSREPRPPCICDATQARRVADVIGQIAGILNGLQIADGEQARRALSQLEQKRPALQALCDEITSGERYRSSFGSFN